MVLQIQNIDKQLMYIPTMAYPMIFYLSIFNYLFGFICSLIAKAVNKNSIKT
jgi:hypothetical protein